VRDNVVTVLTPRAVQAEQIDVQAATRALENPPQGEGRAKAQERARVQLRLARRTSGA
jgi:F0F1-type ATP synthase epsilon subunit